MRIFLVAPLLGVFLSCSVDSSPSSFEDDLVFLGKHTEVRILEAGTGRVAICPALQGRVMTTSLGPNQPGLGFVGRGFIQQPDSEASFHNHGGEERFWIGPESGPFSFYFEPGQAHSRDLWRVPAALDQGSFEVVASGRNFFLLERRMELTNLVGTSFQMMVKREIRSPSLQEVEDLVGPLPEGTVWTGFATANAVRNVGKIAWEREGGMPCIWMAGMFRPGPRAFAILPFGPGDGIAVFRDYFETVPDDRFALGDGFAVFLTDAKREGKLGILRDRAVPRMGAFDPDSGILTLIFFGPIEPTAPYMAQHWGLNLPEPFHGDVVNSYNSGGDPFFELESSSPALELEPGQARIHRSMTLHLRPADPAALPEIASRALGVDWKSVLAARPWADES